MQLSPGEVGGSPIPWAGFGNADKRSPLCSHMQLTLYIMTGGSPECPHFCWGMLAHTSPLTRGPVWAECAILAPGFIKLAAAPAICGLLTMEQVLADVVSDSLPVDVQVDFVLL